MQRAALFLTNPGPPDNPPGAGMLQAPGPGWWWLALKKGPGGEYRGEGQDGQKAGAGGGEAATSRRHMDRNPHAVDSKGRFIWFGIPESRKESRGMVSGGIWLRTDI